jgi:hypothetical protein
MLLCSKDSFILLSMLPYLGNYIYRVFLVKFARADQISYRGTILCVTLQDLIATARTRLDLVFTALSSGAWMGLACAAPMRPSVRPCL